MSPNHPEAPAQAVFHKVAQNLYRLESSGTYYALFKRSGKQIRKSLKTTDATLARRRLAELGAKVSRLSQTNGAGRITFQTLADQWLEKQRVALKEKSISRLDTCLKGLKPVFGHVPVRNIGRQHCEAWMTGRGKSISASSYKHERRVLIAVLDYALSGGLLLDNPARTAVTIRKIAKTKLVIPTREQFVTMVNTIRAADVRAKTAGDLVELLGYSGMRLGEATILTWGDIDWKRNSFTVTGGERGTKNHEARVVPLFPAMKELLGRIRGNTEPAPTDRIISIKNGKRAMTTACLKAELPSFTNHHLRHYFCSNAIEAGIDFKVIAGWLGHKDGGFLVAKTYGHLRDTHSFEMAKRMTFSANTCPPHESN